MKKILIIIAVILIGTALLSFYLNTLGGNTEITLKDLYVSPKGGQAFFVLLTALVGYLMTKKSSMVLQMACGIMFAIGIICIVIFEANVTLYMKKCVSLLVCAAGPAWVGLSTNKTNASVFSRGVFCFRKEIPGEAGDVSFPPY